VAVLFGPSPVTLRVNSNPNTSPAFEIADDVINLRATLSHWTSTATARLAIELSFDGGVADWREFNPQGPNQSPTGTFRNRVDLVWEMAPLWKMCAFVFPANSRYRPGQMCGELYQPGMPFNGGVTIHSDWAHQDTTPLADLSSVQFHNPDLTPSTGPPLRQIRGTMIVSANVSSQLLVESF
jgi:hypothetical protein